ncbi:MAG: enoyl-CoA hydratase/isomerase family protein, partial [Anaerolineae bacterium]
MEFTHLHYDLTDGVATVTLNRPEARNAINMAMRRDFRALGDHLLTDSAVKVVIFTGAGDEAFSAGGDIGHFERDWLTPEFRAHGHHLTEFFNLLETLEKPVIAAVNGVATGAGQQLAMACDLRIASDRARFGFRENFLNLIPGHGGTVRLVKLVGLARAKELIFMGEFISAEEARGIGLVSRVVPHESLLAETQALARKLLQRAPQSLGLVKRLLLAATETDKASALFLESLAQSVLIKTEDHQEGLRAFREKRRP